MLYTVSIHNMRARIWVDELPDLPLVLGKQECESFKNQSDVKAFYNELAIEICLAKHASNYIMLGLKYQKAETTQVSYTVSENGGEVLSNRLSFSADIVRHGIPEVYAQEIPEAMEELCKERKVPNGEYDFVQGAHAEIGSSRYMYEKACIVMMEILSTERISEEWLAEYLQSEMKKY